jgi:hypothetical protein
MSHDPEHPNLGDEPVSSREAEALSALESRLRDERPLPHPGFRGMLRKRLVTDRGAAEVRPGRLRVLITAYASGGLALLALAAAGVFGAGPLAA